MTESPRALLIYKEAFLQDHPSSITEIACMFIGGSRLYYNQQDSQEGDYEGIVVVNSKHEMYSLVSDKRERQRILNLTGIKHEERTNLYIPPPSSPLYHEFDAIQISGYDEDKTKRTITFLSLEYFAQAKVSLNILSDTDRRVYTDSTASSVKLCQGTTLYGSIILHDQWLYISNEKTFVAFGIITNLLLSAVCIYGENPYGEEIKRMLVKYHASARGSFPSAKSFVESSKFSSSYTKWLDGELTRLRPKNSAVAFNPRPRRGEKVFLFGNTIQTRTNAVLCDSASTRSLQVEAVKQFENGEFSQPKGHDPQFSANSSSYIVKTKPPGTIFDIFVKVSSFAEDELNGAITASRFFPRVTVPWIADSGELLYPFFNGTTVSDIRLSYIRGGRRDAILSEKMLYAELVKAEDTLRVYRSSLSLEKNAPGQRYNIQRFFHDRLLNNRRMREHYGRGMTLGGKTIPFDKLLSLRWRINGKFYPSLREAFDNARDIISPDSAQMSSCPLVFGLGDANGGNVMVNQSNAKGGTSDVLFIDYEVAGFHPIMLDLSKPLYNDIFFETLYQELFPGKVNIDLKYCVSVDMNMITIDFKPQIDSLTQAILDVKLRYLIRPVSDELRSLGVNLEDYLPLLSTGLFISTTLSRNFAGNDQAFLSSFATGLILNGAQSWGELASRLEELGFKPRAGLAIQ
ncbi:hypothetical protein F5Y09DRAFT_350652 [Xylaria sp. FL1042]|nr:hypothetical protein F5Y09DRAFT_350652 [Xylaria sp. FL1042]